MFRYPFRVSIERGCRIDHEKLRVLQVHEGYDFELRSLTRAEFQNLRAKYPDWLDFQDAILDLCVVTRPDQFQGRPFEWGDFYAGLAAQVFQKILTLSGFTVAGGAMDPDMINPAREYLGSEEAKYDLLIMTAFHQYKLEALQDLDPRIWHELIGMAEAALRIAGIDPDIIINPGNIQKKQAMAQAEQEAARQLQMMMTKKDGSVVKSTTDQMVFTSGG
jgi:hypothetical protein